MDPIEKIQSSITSISPDSKNRTSEIYLNVINNEFIKINNIISIPRIHVSELKYDIALEIVNDIIEYIPEFLINHFLLSKRKPSSEQHFLQFILPLRGKHIYFLHILKLDLEFSGNPENIVQQGDIDNYPSFKTDRLYYKSRLIPVNSTLKKDNSIIDFTTIRLVQKEHLETDQHFHTFAIFDEADTRKNSFELCQLTGLDRYNISPKLYPFISYDYFTAAFNVLYPTPLEIEAALDLFEPLFIFIYSKSFNWEELITADSINDVFNDSLAIIDKRIELTDAFRSKMDKYFNSFSLYRDDDLFLKGWRRVDISP